MKHIMLDIETLGTGRDAAIVSIGACRFDPTTGEIGATFHKKIKFDNAIGSIDAKTVLWWFEQEDEARKALLEGTRYDIDYALSEFRKFCGDSELEGLWSNGPTFDEMIMRDAYARRNQYWPVSFRTSRCVRTLSMLGRDLGIEYPKFEGVKHDALADAIAQAKFVSKIYVQIMADHRSLTQLATDVRIPGAEL